MIAKSPVESRSPSIGHGGLKPTMRRTCMPAAAYSTGSAIAGISTRTFKDDLSADTLVT